MNPGERDELTEHIAQLERELAHARMKLHEMSLLFELSPAIVIRWQARDGGAIDFVSENIIRFGYTADELLCGSITVDRLTHPEDFYRVQAERTDFLHAGRDACTQEYRVYTRVGAVRWVEAHHVTIRDQQGTTTHVQSTLIDITERKSTEQAQCENAHHFRALVETTSDWVWEIDRDGCYTYASPRVTDLLGYHPDEVLGKTPFDLMPREEVARLEKLVIETIRLRKPIVRLENVNIHKDGRYVVLETSGVPVFDAAGNFAGYRGIDRDITERKQVENAIRGSEERFRGLFERNHAVMLLIDPESGGIFDANPAACKFYGYTRTELTTRRFSDLNAPSPDEGLRELVRDRNREVLSVSACHRMANGDIRDVDVYSGPIQIDDKPMLCCIIHDVTERKHIEQAFMYEKAFLDAAVEVLPMPVAFMSNEWEFIILNKAAREMMERYGLSGFDEIIPLDPLTHTPLPTYRSPLVRSLQGEVITSEEFIFTMPGSDVEIPSLVSAAPILVDGKIVAVVSLFEDITNLKEADKAKDEFLAILSHELQTPLTCILGWSELALSQGTPELLHQAMTVVQRNAHRQKALIADMLDMSRLIHRKLMISLQVTDLIEQTQQAVENMQQQAKHQQITIAFHTEGPSLPIYADAARLQQCLDNLLNNSLKFTPAGGTITVRCRPERDMACLTVQDTGRGILPEALPTIFNPFRQVDRDENAGGLGLGLAIVRGIIELHNGRVWADSAGIGKGCTFTITLPLHPDKMIN